MKIIFLKPKFKYGIQNLLKINIKQSTNPITTQTKTKNFPVVRDIRPEGVGGRGVGKSRRFTEKGPESLTCGQLDIVKRISSSVNHCYLVHLYKH